MSISSSYWGRAIGICFIATAMLATAPLASAQPPATNNVSFDIPAQNLATALTEFARQSNQELFYLPEMAEGKTTEGVTGTMSTAAAMDALLEGTGLEFEPTPNGSLLIGDRATLDARRAEWQSSAAGQQQQSTIGQRRPGIEEIIVTGQKREERIQDVPIAISAFTQEDLTVSQIAGGPDLHLQVPNMTFTKTNFTGYSIQIRGIGTQAISATTDPAVAVALNQTPFIRNRFFEQEFYDLERVEVLRGPQGTLFGRNATAGVVNLITNKPKFQQESMISLDKGNYDSSRWEVMVNTPLVEDQVAFRFAAAGTQRDGYVTNEITDSSIDGRDLWSTRASLRFAPVGGNFDINLIWEHFEEDDDRLRSGKQLCKKDVATEVYGIPVGYFQDFPDNGQGPTVRSNSQALFSQGCERNSLYAEDSFQTVNGQSVPFYLAASAIGVPRNQDVRDPYVSTVQSSDLRVIESTLTPEYRAESDIAELQISYELTDGLTLDSETAYSTDTVFSFQDLNRFNTAPGAWRQPTQNDLDRNFLQEGPNGGGIFCDPQLGCADRLVAADVSTAESSQFSQELRLSSAFGGPFNFSLGANFLRYDTEDKYYVFINGLSASIINNGTVLDSQVDFYVPGETDNLECTSTGVLPPNPDEGYGLFGGCAYMDPNPIGSLNDQGHNYFLSRNPYKLKSYGVFGESYYNVTDTLKLTAGLRWSVDKKSAPRIPSTLLVPETAGSLVAEVIEQEWREPTGRLVLDWKPTLGFTDETLVYGSVARGYKAGGSNPPGFVKVFYGGDDEADILIQQSATKPKTFDAEFVNAFELGTKNTLLDGNLTLNLAAFYYDYKDYQISEIVDRAAFNRNFDAEVWGAEFEADWWALENLRLGFKGGYERTRIRDGEKAVDLMDRAAGGTHLLVTDIQNPNYALAPGEGRPESEYVTGAPSADEPLPADQEFVAYDKWVVHKPFPTFASNCVVPEFIFVPTGGGSEGTVRNPGAQNGGGSGVCENAYLFGLDPVTRDPYQEGGFPGTWDGFYPGFNPEWAPNNGEGFYKDLGGNELPNAPRYNFSLTADYIVPLGGDWIATAHTDIYWQSKSWWRIFNDHEYNRLEPYFTMNLAAIFSNEVSGWNIMAYIKNVTDEDALTGAFLFSDDVGLTTNTFLVEPRLYGLRVTKRWGDGGGPSRWLGHAGSALLGKEPGEPSPWELTVAGHLLRPQEAEAQTFAPSFVTEFSPNIDTTGEQTRDMDWGDGREIVLTYAPENGWRFSLGIRSGKANSEIPPWLKRSELGDVGCKFPTIPGCAVFASGNYPPEYYDLFAHKVDNYSALELQEQEEHTIVDFTVGRDIGLGFGGPSTLSAGLRYAKFTSGTSVGFFGIPDWNLPDPDLPMEKYPTYNHAYDAVADIDREFEGIGPVMSWEASSKLFGDENAGHLDVDWSVSGGVLFGKQETSVSGSEVAQYFTQDTSTGDDTPIVRNLDGRISYENTAIDYERTTRSAVVPTLGADLGLTYRINGFSIGAGYGWERYYGVIDGGIEERKSFDRTVEGPYLKVTFGGGS